MDDGRDGRYPFLFPPTVMNCGNQLFSTEVLRVMKALSSGQSRTLGHPGGTWAAWTKAYISQPIVYNLGWPWD